MWLHAFDTTVGTEVPLWRLVRNSPGSQELKRMSKNPLGKKHCQREAEVLTGPFFFVVFILQWGQNIAFPEYEGCLEVIQDL